MIHLEKKKPRNRRDSEAFSFQAATADLTKPIGDYPLFTSFNRPTTCSFFFKISTYNPGGKGSLDDFESNTLRL